MFDAIVVGLGAMGSATLFELAKRGANVLGIERFTSPHDFGSTHGESRIIRQAYFEGALYVPLVQHATKLWSELEQLSGQTLFLRTGGLFLGKETCELVRGSIRSVEQYGLPHQVLTGSEIRDRFPPIRANDDFIGLFEPAAGVLLPERCVSVFRSLAIERGAEIHDNEEVLGWDASEGEVEIHMADQSYRARSLVLTPGAWLPSLLHGLDLRLAVQRLTMFWFEPTTGIAPLSPDRFPVYVCEAEEGPIFYGFPALGEPSDGVKVAFHDVSFPTDPNAVDRTVSPEEEEMMRETLRCYLPSLDGRLRRTATCLYTMTPDKQFVIDRHPISNRVILASCCSGHGFKFAPAIGEALACLVLEEDPPIDVSAFKLRSYNHPIDLGAKDTEPSWN